MKCTKCGKELPDNALFCKYCGADLSVHAKSNKSAGKKKKWFVVFGVLVVLIAGGLGIYLHSNAQKTPEIAESPNTQKTPEIVETSNVQKTPEIEETSNAVGTVLVKVEGLNIHSAPEASGKILGQVQKDAEYNVYAEPLTGGDYTWYKISETEEQWIPDNGKWLSYTQKNE